MDKAEFYLTSSPFCSSLLKPDAKSLNPWIFSSLFAIDRKIELPAITVATGINENKYKLHRLV